MMGSETSPLRVLIVGAGSAGLLTAQVLKQVNIPCTVFEQDLGLFHRPRDWNFGIYWAQSRLDECLTPELRALVETVQTDPSYVPSASSVLPVYNGETGELIQNLPAPWSLRLRRKKWLQLLSHDIDIQWGKRLESIQTTDDGVTVAFTDGSKEVGSLLVGAEGAHSPTREFLLGAKEGALLQSPIVANVTINTMSTEAALKLRKLHPRYVISTHPNGTFTWHSIHDCSSDDPSEWKWMEMQTWRADHPTGLTNENALPALYDLGAKFGSPFSESFLTIPEGTPVWHNRLCYWPTKKWEGGGKVTLIGDAAHPMTFHRGQGLNNAITDAAELLVHFRAMPTHTSDALRLAVQAYERDMWPRGKQAVEASLENTLAVHDWSTLMQSELIRGGVSRGS